MLIEFDRLMFPSALTRSIPTGDALITVKSSSLVKHGVSVNFRCLLLR